MNIFLWFFRALLLGVFISFITVYALVVFPFYPNSKNKVYRICTFFNRMSALLGLQVKTITSEKSKGVKQAVYIANHQNNADLFTLPHLLRKGVVTVGKKSLVWVPLFGALYWITGNILINRTNRKKAIATIDQVVQKMQTTQLSIMMFPEGTRSRGRGMLPFKSGAFHAAIQAGLPIIPIVCSNTHKQVQLGRWNNGDVIVEMLDPISTKGLSKKNTSALIKQCEEMMKAKYEELNTTLMRSEENMQK